MISSITEEEYAAVIILRESGVKVLEAAFLARDALTAGKGVLSRARKCIELGVKELKNLEKTVIFRKAVEKALEARLHRRNRTQSDFRYHCRRLMKNCPGLEKRRIRSIKPEECRRWIQQTFHTPQQRRKARAILSGVFSTAQRNGWCSHNPISQVEQPRVPESPLPILQPEEIRQLLQTAEEYKGGCCLAAIGLMLYAGIRPHEVIRLTWQQIDLQNGRVYIHPRHSKTGGARSVTLHPPLVRILQHKKQAAAVKICPANWTYHWRELRRLAGWGATGHPWRQDVLRHTFASYHLQHFRSYSLLQCEIGHRDSNLLRTRYVDMRGVENAGAFWSAPAES